MISRDLDVAESHCKPDQFEAFVRKMIAFQLLRQYTFRFAAKMVSDVHRGSIDVLLKFMVVAVALKMKPFLLTNHGEDC